MRAASLAVWLCLVALGGCSVEVAGARRAIDGAGDASLDAGGAVVAPGSLATGGPLANDPLLGTVSDVVSCLSGTLMGSFECPAGAVAFLSPQITGDVRIDLLDHGGAVLEIADGSGMQATTRFAPVAATFHGTFDCSSMALRGTLEGAYGDGVFAQDFSGSLEADYDAATGTFGDGTITIVGDLTTSDAACTFTLAGER